MEIVEYMFGCFGREEKIIKHYKIQKEIGGVNTEISKRKNKDAVT